MQGSGIRRSVAPPSTRDQGRGRGGPFQHRGRGSLVSKTVDHLTPTIPTRAYAMRAREDQDAPGVIVGNFTLYNTEIHVLIDPYSTHSYICIEQLSDKKTVLLKRSDMSKVTVHGILAEVVSKVISAMQARRFLRKGCEALLALVLESRKEQVNLEKISLVREFPNVFP